MAGSTHGRLTLLAFHHAGGSPVAFAGWQRRLGPRVRVEAVALPTRHATFDGMVAELAERLGGRMTGHEAFYGHSMGGIIAYRLARRLVRSGRPAPSRLLVGALAAPHLSGIAAARDLGDEALARWLLEVGGPRRLPSTPDRLAEALARLRNDLRLCATVGAEDDGPGLPCPVDIFAGTHDPIVPVEETVHWHRYAPAGCTVHIIPGGHFFTRDSRQAFFAALRRVLCDGSEVARLLTYLDEAN